MLPPLLYVSRAAILGLKALGSGRSEHDSHPLHVLPAGLRRAILVASCHWCPPQLDPRRSRIAIQQCSLSLFLPLAARQLDAGIQIRMSRDSLRT